MICILMTQQCKNMIVGETYGVHWLHSAAEACEACPYQYRTLPLDTVCSMLWPIRLECRRRCLQSWMLKATAGPTSCAALHVNMPRDWTKLWADCVSLVQSRGMFTGSATSCWPWVLTRCWHSMMTLTDDLHPHDSRELVSDELATDDHGRRHG